MKIKATVLSENCVFHKSGLIAEHGWSVFIETEYGNYLFDTGQGKAIINNSNYLGKDLKSIKAIIISHHHIDHTGGLLPVLEITGKMKIYTHPEIFKSSFNVRNKKEKYIGMPYNLEILENKGAEFVFNKIPLQIQNNIIITGEIPRKTSYEKGEGKQVLKTKNGYIQDNINDDQALILNTNSNGLFIILGCSHSGIINTINYAMEITGIKHIHTIIGGTHLGPIKEEVRNKSIQALKQFDIERIGVSHCTGLEASTQLLNEFNERFFFCNTGTVVEV